MSKQFVIRSPRLDRAVDSSVSPMHTHLSTREHRAGRLITWLSSQEVYDGLFSMKYNRKTEKIDINTGYISRNGQVSMVDGTSIEPQTGIICVCSSLEDNGWTNPVVQFAIPNDTNYPIGSCVVTQLSESKKNVKINCCRVGMAIIIATVNCEQHLDD